MFELDVDPTTSAKLKVIGCGGAGGNAVNRMIGAGLRGVEFIVANTDIQALNQSLAPTRVQIGMGTTRGLGAGGDPSHGRRAAEEDEQAIADALADSDMVFITAGMGGGTGTGSAPVVARMARQSGALTVAVVTKPFVFEGRRRMRQAEEGLAELRNEVDTLIVIPNERLLAVVDRGTSLSDAFSVCDEVLLKATKGISDLVTVPGLVNLDFADVKAVMSNRGNALMGTGRATGETRAVEAAQAAVSSPLLEDVSIAGAEGVLVNITGGRDLTLHEVNEAAGIVVGAAGDEANVIFGSVIDPNLDGEIMITVIATGFGQAEPRLRLIPSQTADATAEAAQEDLRHPQGWRRGEEQRGSRWNRSTGTRGESMDVPTFLRKQMD
jgi:cell division protein FtsZ